MIFKKGSPIKSNHETFTGQEVKLRDSFLYFPEGFEEIFLAIYFITLPYIAGLLFLFFYVAEGSPALFKSLSSEGSIFLTWTIGYEVLAAFALLIIIKKAIFFSINAHKDHKNGKVSHFTRP